MFQRCFSPQLGRLAETEKAQAFKRIAEKHFTHLDLMVLVVNDGKACSRYETTKELLQLMTPIEVYIIAHIIYSDVVHSIQSQWCRYNCVSSQLSLEFWPHLQLTASVTENENRSHGSSDTRTENKQTRP